ncbi:hypothetical protein [Chroococcidiopsis sp.]|uniref:hypothetical protein n=1 Tax=Chroococcidiopsis sp. TaxID=3088168 RepID=UPI003F3AB480
MYNKADFLKQHVAQTQIVREVKLSEQTVNDTKSPQFNTSDLLMLLGPIGFIMGWTILFLMLSKIGVAARDELLFTIKRFQKVPCRNCQYFTNNPYLKCAVNPGAVLTEEALKCSDYRPGEKVEELDDED